MRLPGGLVIFAWLATLLVAAAVLLLLGFLWREGWQTLGLALLFGEAPVWAALRGAVPVWDGLWPACVGTLMLVLLSALLAVPVGVCSGIYLAIFAAGRSKQLLTLGIKILAGIPSILMGLFGFALILFLRQTIMPQANTGLLLAASCLTLLVLPYLILATQTSLEGLPPDLHLVGWALGFSPWQLTRHILLPAASRGILSGIILTLGRTAEDTAVILLTGVVANAGLPQRLTDKFAALPFAIYYLAAEHRTEAELARGFGAALVLLLLTAVLLGLAHLLHWLGKRYGR
jgi:phosphate transport system permease protein